MQSRGIETKKGQSIGPATQGKKFGTFLSPPLTPLIGTAMLLTAKPKQRSN